MRFQAVRKEHQSNQVKHNNDGECLFLSFIHPWMRIFERLPFMNNIFVDEHEEHLEDESFVDGSIKSNCDDTKALVASSNSFNDTSNSS